MRDTEHELFIACQVNGLRKFTPVFIQTFGWIVSRKVPKAWAAYVNLSKVQYSEIPKKSFMMLFMEQSNYKFKSKAVRFDEKQYLTILFILLHALYIARRELHFTHSDLHMGNIMLDITHETHLNLAIGDNDTFDIALPNGFLPKIIDFGHSQTLQAKDGGRRKNDVATVFAAIEARAQRYDSHVDVSSISEFKEYNMDLEQLLLVHPLFDKIRKRKKNPNKKPKVAIERCFMCNGQAKLTWAPNRLYKFCDFYCAEKMNGIIDLL
jgi:serine/threonine protein kinase